MRLYINDNWIVDSIILQEIDEALTKWFKENNGQAVYAYKCDGDIYFDDYVAFLNQNVSSDEEVHLLVKHETELKKELKDSVLDYCHRVQNELPKVIDPLYGQHPEKEDNHIADLFEGLNYLISSASLLHLDSLLKGRHEAVIELSEAYKAKDYIELGDLLKYDWLPWVTKFEKELNQLHVGM